MTRNIVFRIVSALILVAAIVGIGTFAFRAGFAQGAAADVQLPTGEGGALPYPYFGYGWYPFVFPGFGFFGLLIPIFLFFLVIGAFRRLIWGPRWNWHMHRRDWGSPMNGKTWGEGVPPFFAEWHRRAHQSPEDSKKSTE